MIAEAINRIQQLCVAAQSPSVVQIPGDPTRCVLTTRDKTEVLTVPPAPRAHSVTALADFVALLQNRAVAANAFCFLGRTSVVALLDHADRRERVTLALLNSDRWITVAGLGARELSQKEAVHLLRMKLQDTGKDAARLAAAIKTIEFERTGSGKRTVEHGRETLGKEVESIVQGVDGIPETVEFLVPIWAGPDLEGYTAKVKCGVYIDVEDETFTITPLGDEIENATQEALDRLRTEIEERSGIPTFRGQPS